MWFFFLYFYPIWSFSPIFWAGYRVACIRFAWNDKSATCNCLSNCFYLIFWSRLGGSSAQSYEKWSFFSAFTRLGLLPQVFGQVNECPILKLHDMIIVLHVVACPIIFILFDDRGWQGVVFKVVKDVQFLVFLVVWVLFLRFLGWLRSGLCWDCTK